MEPRRCRFDEQCNARSPISPVQIEDKAREKLKKRDACFSSSSQAVSSVTINSSGSQMIEQAVTSQSAIRESITPARCMPRNRNAPVKQGHLQAAARTVRCSVFLLGSSSVSNSSGGDT
jgi:hypothetical protein